MFLLSFSSVSPNLFCQLSNSDLYHGHEHITKLCARFSLYLILCPDIPLLPLALSTSPMPCLERFIAYALHCTCLHMSITFTVLYLLQHLRLILCSLFTLHPCPLQDAPASSPLLRQNSELHILILSPPPCYFTAIMHHYSHMHPMCCRHPPMHNMWGPVI